MDKVIPIAAGTPRRRILRADVPPFDPNNSRHVAAWEAMWDFGQYWRAKEGNGDAH